MIFNDPVVALRWTLALATVASLIVCSELIAVWSWYRDGAFWRCCIGVTENQQGAIGWVLGLFRRYMPAVFVVNALAGVTTLVMIVHGGSYREALYVLTLSSLIIANWRVVGGDGAQQMITIVLTAASLSVLVGGETRGARPALLFIGCQGLLAYFAAGVAKVVSKEWRNEDVVSKVASTVSYGNYGAVRSIALIPGLGRALTLTVICFEIAMPLAIFIPMPLPFVLLGIALSFHIGCAFIMGLNDFVWAFASTFPAILFIASIVRF